MIETLRISSMNVPKLYITSFSVTNYCQLL